MILIKRQRQHTTTNIVHLAGSAKIEDERNKET
jgi:hypothetical protein